MLMLLNLNTGYAKSELCPCDLKMTRTINKNIFRLDAVIKTVMLAQKCLSPNMSHPRTFKKWLS